MTKKLFQEDVYRKECSATVTEVSGDGSEKNPTVLVLDQTVFFPTGGGQPCDLGTINQIPVADVSERNGVIYHTLQPQPSSSQTVFKPNDQVTCMLDWERRFEHMQRHCGEHILSGIFFRELGGVNRGFHMGKDYMTVDIDVPAIIWETAQKIETLTNEVIWENVPVTTRFFASKEEAERLPLRKALAIDEDISIVCVGAEDNPADCVACCGTHPGTSGQVGIVKIVGLENYKGMTRVYFKAGKEALVDYQNKQDILTKLNHKYSSDDSSLIGKMKAQDDKNKEIRQELHRIKNAFLSKEIDELLKDAAPNAVLIREYPVFSATDLMNMVKVATEKTTSIFALIATLENTVILASSGSCDCGKVIKDNANIWRGKGGGNSTGGRALFPSRDDLDCFISFIAQAYGSAGR